MKTERISFRGHNGDILDARMDRPSGQQRATAIFAHCFTCSKDIAAARRISQRLASMGIAVLRFDFTGLGHSEGEFENTHFTSNVEDLLAAANHLREMKQAPCMLIGHSLGGSAVLRAASQLDGIKAVVTLGAPADVSHVLQNFGSSLEKIKADGVADLTLAGRPFRIKKEFVDDACSHKLKESIASLNAALLIMHAPLDATVSIENASEIFIAAKHPKSFVSLDKADHLLSNTEDANYAAEVIGSWAKRYLGLMQPAAPIGAPEGIIRSTEADPEGFMQDVTAGPLFHALADEPISYGGTNKGMSPFQFLSAGLAACTSMTIRMYARRKGWPLDAIHVDVTHNKVHAQDCETCEGMEGKVDHFNRDIHLSGALSDDQRQRLLEIADKCPVHKTLERKSMITSQIARS